MSEDIKEELAEELQEEESKLVKENEELRKEVNEVNEKLRKVSEHINSMNDSYKSKMKDLELIKERNIRELSKAKDQANEKIVLSFLEVLDNFDRALSTEGDIRDGVELIRKQFKDVLAKEGVEEISTDKFDPNLHEAIAFEESGEESLEEIRKGYKLKEKVIRPTLVKVYK